MGRKTHDDIILLCQAEPKIQCLHQRQKERHREDDTEMKVGCSDVITRSQQHQSCQKLGKLGRILFWSIHMNMMESGFPFRRPWIQFSLPYLHGCGMTFVSFFATNIHWRLPTLKPTHRLHTNIYQHGCLCVYPPLSSYMANLGLPQVQIWRTCLLDPAYCYSEMNKYFLRTILYITCILNKVTFMDFLLWNPWSLWRCSQGTKAEKTPHPRLFRNHGQIKNRTLISPEPNEAMGERSSKTISAAPKNSHSLRWLLPTLCELDDAPIYLLVNKMPGGPGEPVLWTILITSSTLG